ncbi:MAG: D-glycero-alpha-D-manno-heptose 7-phosphate kinase [Candidatus Anoxychlamydiales bacterium]|nr:D-glycero-alpha-D-manno-heptose 7-phosphate kinase [Candidatus Anoxychlamydiales bacterium]NGX36032.1 D-glycero-alpha-D-manno-heptose 7-phosphate kinase [Candidatus Anoxychlamydiales bacterium]
MEKKSPFRMIISRTPVRISLFGGGTDYPAFYERHSGIVLGTTINKYTYVSVNTLSEFFEHNIRIGYSKTELVKNPDEIQHPSIRECLKYKNIAGNLDIHIFADLPAKTGLGSSSSFTVGFLNALNALQGKKVSKQKLAEEAIFIEQELIKENVGSQDQFHASFGGLNIMEFSPNKINVRPVIISTAKLKLLEDSLMIFYTGLTRFASDIVKEQIDKTKTRSNDQYLLEMKEMVCTAEQIISNSQDQVMIKDLGSLLDESWQLKKKLSSKISNSKIDESYKIAKDAGAYGGKLCGAGSGGFLALLAPENKKTEIREKLKKLLEVDFKFENQGSTIIYMKD